MKFTTLSLTLAAALLMSSTDAIKLEQKSIAPEPVDVMHVQTKARVGARVSTLSKDWPHDKPDLYANSLV